MSLDNLFEPQGTVEPAVTEQPQAEPVVEQQTTEGAPTAPQQVEKHVPLAALEAERTQRQDWKEKATRAEERLRVYEERERGNQQPNAQGQQIDPVFNLRLDMSEQLLKSMLPEAKDIDEKVETFKRAAQADPSLSVAMMRHPHPWKFAYDKANEMEMLRQIGTDPAAYRARLEAEIRASMQPAAAPLNLPVSLNGARSVASRSASAWTGPRPITEILPQ